MGEEIREVARFELDTTEAAARAQRLLNLMNQLSETRKGGGDTSGFEQEIAGELDALGNLVPKQKQAAAGTADLLKQKEALAGVVRILGGEFGGMIGPFGRVVDMLSAAHPAALAAAAALAGVVALATGFRHFAEEARKATEEVQRWNQAVAESKNAQLSTVAQVEAGLGKFGLRTAEGSQAARGMMFGLQRAFGYSPEEAAAFTPVSVAAGLSIEEAGTVGQLQAMGYKIDTAAGARELLTTLDPAILAEAKRRLAGMRGTESGKAAMSVAETYAGRVPAERAVAKLQALGERDLTVNQVRDRAKRADEILRELDELGEMERASSGVIDFEGAGPEPYTAGMRSRLERELRDTFRYKAALEREEQFGVVEGPVSAGVGSAGAALQGAIERSVTIHNHNNTTYIGTNYGISPSMSEAAAGINALEAER